MFGGGIGFQEIVIILVIAVVLFGSRLPSVARSLGQSYQQFRKGLSDLQSSIHVPLDDPPQQSGPPGLPDFSDTYSGLEDESVPNFQPPSDEVSNDSPTESN